MHILLLGPEWRNRPIATYLEGRNHRVSLFNDRFTAPWAKEQAVEFIISSGYGPIIKPPVVQAFPRKIINLHSTYLPWGKGIGPLLFSILEGSPLGVTIHYIDEGIDSGDILFRRKVSFASQGTLRSLYHDVLAELEILFYESWPDIESGNVKPVQQATLGVDVSYRSRVDSEKFMDYLPQVWDTPIKTLRQWAVAFQCNQDFWKIFEGECK